MLGKMLCTALVLTLFAANVSAADVDADASTRETYVGLPIILRINVNNATDHETPIMPEVDGLKIELAGPPSRSSQTMWINGRKTHRTTVSYAFRVTPLREGTFTIPPVKVVADGLSSITKAVRVVASKSDTDDLLFAEVSASDQKVYVGQALDLKLKIWVRPYRNADYQVELDEQGMWQMLSNESSWGPFQEAVEELVQSRRLPPARSVMRTDSEGQEREYLLYEIDARIFPNRPGRIDGQQVRVVMNYPTEIGRARSPFSMLEDDDLGGSLLDDSFFRSFSNRLTVTKSRPIVAETVMQPTEVREIPTQGRPADFLGAVGSYRLSTEAKPSRVQVGEPITLRLILEGDGPLDLLQAPVLAQQEDLVRDFKVPDETLAGVVQGASKVFSTSIRPLREEVSEIPPITYTFFDPQREQFVTVKSEPIPLEVQAADVLALDSIVGSPRSAASRPLPQPTAPLPQQVETTIFTDVGLLASVNRPSPWNSLQSPMALILIFGPPLAFLMFLFVRLRGVPMAWIPARRKLTRSLIRAQTGAQVSFALQEYLAAHFGIARGRLTRDQTIGALRGADRHDLAIRLERIYRASDSVSSDSLIHCRQEAEAIASEASRIRRLPGAERIWATVGSQSSSLMWLALPALLCEASPLFAANLELSLEQQRQVLSEGLDQFQQASATSDRTLAIENYRGAADSFQLLIDSGITNDRLYFNLAEALRRSDQPAESIANYRRALRWNPDEILYRRRLAEVEARTGVVSQVSSRPLTRLQRWLFHQIPWVPPRLLLFASLAAWLAFWGILIARGLRWIRSWKLAAAIAVVIVLMCGGMYASGVNEFMSDGTAVVLSDNVSLRAGDGEEFEETASLQGQPGQTVRVLAERGDWLHVELDEGQQGWVRRNQVAAI